MSSMKNIDRSTIYRRRQAFFAQYDALCAENVETGSGLEKHEILSLLMVKKGEGFDLAHIAENTGLSVQQVEALGEATDCLDVYIQTLRPLPSVQGVSSLPVGLRMFIATDPLLMAAHIDELIVDNCAVLEQLARNIRLSKAHIDTLLSFQDVHVLRVLAEHPNLTASQINELIDDGDEELLEIVARHPNLTNQNINKLLELEDLRVLWALAEHPSLTTEPYSYSHIDWLIDVEDEELLKIVAKHPSLTPRLLSRLIDDEDMDLLEIVARHPNLTTENIDEILKLHDDIIVLRILAAHPNLTAAHINQLIDGGDEELLEIVAKRSDLTEAHIDRILKAGSVNARYALIRNPNLTQKHMDRLLEDEDYGVATGMGGHCAAALVAKNSKKGESSMSKKVCTGLDGNEYVFDQDRSQQWPEDTVFDGNSHVSCATGSQWTHEGLYLTAGGRWIKESWGSSGEGSSFNEITAKDAVIWFVKNNAEIPDELQAALKEVEI